MWSKQGAYLQATQNSLAGAMVDAPTLLGYSPAELSHDYIYRTANDNLPMVVTDHTGESGGDWVGDTGALYAAFFGRWGQHGDNED